MKRALVTGGSGDLGGRSASASGATACTSSSMLAANIPNGRRRWSMPFGRRAVRRKRWRSMSPTRSRPAAALTSLLKLGRFRCWSTTPASTPTRRWPACRAQWRRVIEVCLHGFFNVTQPLLLPMLGTRWGRIVNISSLAGVTGNRGQTNYAAAKAGLHGATKALALELASRGITVNAIAPGIIARSATDAGVRRGGHPAAGADATGGDAGRSRRPGRFSDLRGSGLSDRADHRSQRRDHLSADHDRRRRHSRL
jgi:3-oxoacyl-[acyl-carrier protein] reductase